MTTAPVVTVPLLADCPHLIEAVGDLRWREWGHAPEPDRREWWVAVTALEAGREALPVTWVAVDAHGQAVGAVGLGEFDLEERRDRSPWVLGLIVAPPQRGQGIGGQLMAALEAGARRRGFRQGWVATSGRAVRFYAKQGWAPLETFERQGGELTTILTKAL